MWEEKAACSFEQTPGGWLPTGRKLGGGAGLTAHRPGQPLRQDSALLNSPAFARLAVGLEVNDQPQSPS